MNTYGQKADSLIWKPIPRTFRIGVDVLGLTKSLVQPNLSILEFNGEIDTKKYIFAMDIGRYSHTIDSLPTYKYHVKGSYFRLGADINLIHKDPDGSVVLFGIRYARARFDDQLDYTFEDPVWGQYPNQTAANKGAKANWLELNFGMRARIFKALWMGYQARYKFGLKIKSDALVPYEVPGYGPSETVTDKNTYWGFNYYVQLGINAVK